MERPKKYNIEEEIKTDFYPFTTTASWQKEVDKAILEAYNRACDDWEAFLPSKEEIQDIINSRLDCPDCDNSGILPGSGEQCEFCYREENSKFNLAKAIHKRLRGE